MPFTIKEQVLMNMDLFYTSKDKANDWYNKPHTFFKDKWDKNLSPKQMIELDRGNEVLEWIKLCLE